MGSRQVDIDKLVERCRRVGWTVEQPPSGAGWRIHCADGTFHQLHKTYSDINAYKIVLATLNKHGLSATEREQRLKRAASKTVKLAREREAAEVRAARMAAQAHTAALTRAAGPYSGPEVIDADWFLQPHPAPWMRWAVITPVLAAKILTANTDNRPMSRNTVDYYRRLILAGQHRLTHQGMAMDTRGVVQDGQQRLQACVEAERDIETAFFVGMEPDNFKAIDEGRNRTAADLLGKDEEPNSSTASTTVKLIIATRKPFPRKVMKSKISNASIYDAFYGDRQRLRDAVQWSKRHHAKAGLVVAALAAGRYLIREVHDPENQYVEAFFNGLASGVKGETRILLDADDPRLKLREQLQTRREHRQRTSAIEQLGLIIWAWNCVASGRRARRVNWPELVEGAVPAVTLCADRGHNASAPPELLRGEFVR